jgi:hypothetical protein
MDQKKLESFLDVRPIILMLCFDNTMLMQLKVVPTKGKNATEVGFSL